jgi:hypothetical protein
MSDGSFELELKKRINNNDRLAGYVFNAIRKAGFFDPAFSEKLGREVDEGFFKEIEQRRHVPENELGQRWQDYQEAKRIVEKFEAFIQSRHLHWDAVAMIDEIKELDGIVEIEDAITARDHHAYVTGLDNYYDLVELSVDEKGGEIAESVLPLARSANGHGIIQNGMCLRVRVGSKMGSDGKNHPTAVVSLKDLPTDPTERTEIETYFLLDQHDSREAFMDLFDISLAQRVSLDIQLPRTLDEMNQLEANAAYSSKFTVPEKLGRDTLIRLLKDPQRFPLDDDRTAQAVHYVCEDVFANPEYADCALYRVLELHQRREFRNVRDEHGMLMVEISADRVSERPNVYIPDEILAMIRKQYGIQAPTPDKVTSAGHRRSYRLIEIEQKDPTAAHLIRELDVLFSGEPHDPNMKHYEEYRAIWENFSPEEQALSETLASMVHQAKGSKQITGICHIVPSVMQEASQQAAEATSR